MGHTYQGLKPSLISLDRFGTTEVVPKRGRSADAKKPGGEPGLFACLLSLPPTFSWQSSWLPSLPPSLLPSSPPSLPRTSSRPFRPLRQRFSLRPSLRPSWREPSLLLSWLAPEPLGLLSWPEPESLLLLSWPELSLLPSWGLVQVRELRQQSHPLRQQHLRRHPRR